MERGDYDGDNDGILFSVLLLVDIIFGAFVVVYIIWWCYFLFVARGYWRSPSGWDWSRRRQMVRWSRHRWMVRLEPPSSDGAIEAAIVWCYWSHRHQMVRWSRHRWMVWLEPPSDGAMKPPSLDGDNNEWVVVMCILHLIRQISPRKIEGCLNFWI